MTDNETVMQRDCLQVRERNPLKWRRLNLSRLRSRLATVKTTKEALGRAQVVRRETLKSTISV